MLIPRLIGSAIGFLLLFAGMTRWQPMERGMKLGLYGAVWVYELAWLWR